MPAVFELCPGRKIGGSNPCFIIAEIGQNHQGDIDIAKKMIRMAKVKYCFIRREVIQTTGYVDINFSRTSKLQHASNNVTKGKFL